MKSTQAMRDRIRELMTDPIDDYDRAVLCVLNELEHMLNEPQTVREPGDEHPVLKHCDELHDLGFNAGWNGAIEEAAKLVRPKKPRPCDCERCYCGNHGDLEAVAVWDADKANADAILALTRPVRGDE
jgi:hypothetical protein